MRSRQLAGTAAAKLARAVRPAGQRAVEEDGQLELGDPAGRRATQRLRAGGAAPRVVEVDDGDHVDRADVGMDAGVPREIDARERLAGAGQQRGRQPCPARRRG